MFDNVVTLIEKKSKFIAHLFKCTNETQIADALNLLKSQHKKATHICYAYRLTTPFAEKACDDGEPSGTAGRPILSVLQKRDVQNACIFVVRYFGGIKLGAGGLVRMYSKAAGALLTTNPSGEK